MKNRTVRNTRKRLLARPVRPMRQVKTHRVRGKKDAAMRGKSPTIAVSDADARRLLRQIDHWASEQIKDGRGKWPEGTHIQARLIDEAHAQGHVVTLALIRLGIPNFPDTLYVGNYRQDRDAILQRLGPSFTATADLLQARLELRHGELLTKLSAPTSAVCFPASDQDGPSDGFYFPRRN